MKLEIGEGIFLTRASPRAKLTEMMHDAAVVCAQLESQHRAMMSGVPFTIDDIAESMAKGTALDSEFEEWQWDLPEKWHFRKEPLLRAPERRPRWSAELLSQPGAPAECYIYNEVLHALSWSLWRATRMHVQLAMLNLAVLANRTLISENGPPVQQVFIDGLIKSITRLIDGIVMTIPFPLQISQSGNEDPETENGIMSQRGFLLLWPVLAALKGFSNPIILARDSQSRLSWTLSVLRFLRSDLGFVKASAWVSQHAEIGHNQWVSNVCS